MMNLRQVKVFALLGVLIFCSLVAASDAPPELFVTSARCLACHNGLVAPTGEDVSIGVDWRSSMMANSARDPYWQAAIRRETLVHPKAKSAIEDECSACHMPMARFQANAEGRAGRVFDHLPLNRAETSEAHRAADGVSCSVCHQIQKENLGKKESFTAGFVLDETTPSGQRRIFGPYKVDVGRTRLMRSAALFEPSESTHVQRSEVCATCHTLFTHAMDENGKVVGELPEQVPYLEWRHSAFYQKTSCQSCHMPEVDGQMPVSSVLGVDRAHVSRHVFRGGNFFMPRILNRYQAELAVQALPQEMVTTANRTTQHLKTKSAKLVIEDAVQFEGTLTTLVSITNLAGHKLPSAYPSRRVWIHLAVRDDNGKAVFESGRLNPDGSISGNANDLDAGRFEPHYEKIDHPDQVQIYEPIMANAKDEVTTVLLSAVRYVKDNRLLPDGFDKTTAEKDIRVHGGADQDINFVAGSDQIAYEVDVRDAKAPFTVEATLYYQPIAYRWAHNMKQQTARETDRFVRLYQSMANASATVLARAKAQATWMDSTAMVEEE